MTSARTIASPRPVGPFRWRAGYRGSGTPRRSDPAPRRHARPVVRDPDFHVVPVTRCAAPTRISEPGGAKRNAFSSRLSRIWSIIVDVERHGREIVGDVEPDAVGAGDGPQPPDGVLHEIGDVDRFVLDLERAGADAAQLERVAHQPLEPFRLVGDRLEQLAPFLGLDARPRRQQRAGGRLHRGQRRAQVVAHRRQEAGALPPDLGDEARRRAPPPGVAADRRRPRARRRELRAARGRRGADPRRSGRRGSRPDRRRGRRGRRRLLGRADRRRRSGARIEPEQVDERVRRAASDSSTSAPVEQAVREVEPQLGFGLALQARSPQGRQPLHGPADQAADAANTTSATTSSVRWILNEPVGSVKNQLREKNPTIAAAIPAGKPSVPTREDGDEQQQRGGREVGVHGPAAIPATAPTAITASVTRTTDRSESFIPADTIAWIRRPQPHRAVASGLLGRGPLASGDADVRNAFDARSRRLGDAAPEARPHPAVPPRSRRSASRCTRSTR